MKRIFQFIFRLLAGLAIAAILLAVLLPLLIRGGYLEVGTTAGLWIVGIVGLLCVTIVLCWPLTSHRE
jgi:hypothetical protein